MKTFDLWNGRVVIWVWDPNSPALDASISQTTLCQEASSSILCFCSQWGQNISLCCLFFWKNVFEKNYLKQKNPFRFERNFFEKDIFKINILERFLLLRNLLEKNIFEINLQKRNVFERNILEKNTSKGNLLKRNLFKRNHFEKNLFSAISWK